MKRRAILLLAAMGTALLLSSAAALAINTVQCKVDRTCNGTAAADLMRGTGSSDWMHGKGRGDTLRGFGNTSEFEEGLYGEGGNDKLYGGPGWDILVGGPGNDTMRGDEVGDHFVDHYQFTSNSWGNDAIEDTPSVLRGTGPFFVSNVVVFTGGVSANLYVNLTSSGQRHEATTGTSAVNWEGSVVDDVQNQGTGYDTIIGNNATNTIQSVGFDPNVGTISGGVDAVRALGGDDSVNVDDGVGDDAVDCGEGSDTVRFDAGDDVSANCENKTQDNNQVP
jgi:hypothetical protein